MAKPTNTISKINPNGTTYTICPTMMTDETGTYKATLPTLTKDETIATKSDIDAIGSPMIFKGTATVTKSGSSYTVAVATPSLTSVKDGYTYKITTAPENDNNFKVGDTLIANKNNPGSNPQSNWSLIPSGDDSGSILDVQIGGTSIVSSGTANIVTGSTYNASSNPIATMNDIITPFTAVAGTDFTNVEGSNIIILTTNFENAIKNKSDIIFTNLTAGGFNFDNVYLRFKSKYIHTDSYINIWESKVANFESSHKFMFFVTIDNSTGNITSSSYNSIPEVVGLDWASASSKTLMLRIGDTQYDTWGYGVDADKIVEKGLPTYTSSNSNYVLSVDSSGNLVWRAPYNGEASGS